MFNRVVGLVALCLLLNGGGKRRRPPYRVHVAVTDDTALLDERLVKQKTEQGYLDNGRVTSKTEDEEIELTQGVPF
jgi:hypothetical protein